MKKIVLFTLAVFIIFTGFSPYCIDQKINIHALTDYRDSYVGYYFCSRTAAVPVSGRGPTTYKDTITISITKDAVDSVLSIAVGALNSKFKVVNDILYSDEGKPQGGKFYPTNRVYFILATGKGSSAAYFGRKK